MSEWWQEWSVSIPFIQSGLVREKILVLHLEDLVECNVTALSADSPKRPADCLVSVVAEQPITSHEYDTLVDLLIFIAENCVQGTKHDDQFVDIVYSHERENVLLTNGSIYTVDGYDVKVDWNTETVQYSIAMNTWGPSDKPSIKVKGTLYGENGQTNEDKESEVQGELFPV